jgi:wyosine [tRNA(Phe)-imidazoG37] synthetase (radical SAM superfamily)
MPNEPFQPECLVKTCSKLESGLNLAVNGLRACTRGAFMPPLFCSIEEIAQGIVDKEFIIRKRKEYIQILNDDHSEIACKRCLMVEQKKYGDLAFSRLGHIDLQHYSICNLRCKYCAYTRDDLHYPPQYDALAILRLFSPDDVEWNAHVDFAGGEPTLLDNLEEYLDFFRTRRIRVLMFTNGVRFHHAIYNGLADGSLYLAATSLDAGTPSTFKALRGRDSYLQVLENLSRYAAAGSKGKGILAVKYIFSDGNWSDDDIAGFAYAMLALRPQQVWLTFDFSPLYLRSSDYDYTLQIQAYAKLYLLLKKHGLEAFHYYQEAIGTVSPEGKEIMNRILGTIERESSMTCLSEPDFVFPNFRTGEPLPCQSDNWTFSVDPLTLNRKDGFSEKWSLVGKRALLAPACPATVKLLSDPEIQLAEWVGFVDRNPIQQGKIVEGRTIYSYEAIGPLRPDVILVSAPEKHRRDILQSIFHKAAPGVTIAEFEGY